MNRVRTLFIAICLITGCETPPKKGDAEKSPSKSTQTEIDYQGLKRHLGLNRSPKNLGFAEAPFDSCIDGFNFPETNVCEKNYFVVVNFRLQCRNSTGTVSEAVTSADVEAISDKKVKWNLKDLNGTTSTDSQGFGQIEVVSPISQKAQRLRLAIDREFLYIRAGDITRVVTPATWCD